MPKVTISILAGLAAVCGMAVGLSVVSASLTPLIGVPMLVLAAALALTGQHARSEPGQRP
jgi:hypothetical protein